VAGFIQRGNQKKLISDLNKLNYKMSYSKWNITVINVFVICLNLFSQIDNKALYNPIKMDEKDSSKIMLSIKNQNILIDNEYFGKIATGYTLFGSQLNPEIAYMPNKYLKIQGGIFLQKDYGNPDYSIVAPTLSLKLQKNGYSFIFGNLEGCLSHQLIQPIFNYERIYTYPLENGLQFKVDKKKFWFDMWIDWEQQEYQSSNYKEHIGAGMSSKITLYNHNDVFKIILPVQGYVYHNGGQLDVDSLHLITLLNYAAGLTFDFDLSKYSGFITGIRSDNYFAGFHNGSAAQNEFPYYTTFRDPYYYNNINHFPTPINSGYGTYLNLTITSKYHVSLMASYWGGNNFVAGHGGVLYQSVSSEAGVNYMQTSRNLIFLRALYLYEILPDLYLDIRFEPEYDLKFPSVTNTFNPRLEFAYSAFVTYRKVFSLGKIKPD
jgi:hypothetical protein